MKATRIFSSTIVIALAATLAPLTQAAPFQLRVTVENLSPVNSISFAPLRLGFGSGLFDAFDNGTTASAAIISVAEGGSGSDWFPAFSAADPTAVLGTVLPSPAGPLTPGLAGSAVFSVDTVLNRYFAFASMVVPSNDVFIGNDSPTAFNLFDDDGNLQLFSITQFGSDIWDAGSEAFDPANAAFVMGGDNDLRTPQNGVVAFDFSELTGFNGFTTGAGYVFDRQFTSSTPLYRITLSAVDEMEAPEPASAGLLGLGLAALGLLKKRRSQAQSAAFAA